MPVPGETTLTVAGVLGQQPTYHLNVILLIVATTVGTFAGSMISYGIGRTLGRPFLEKFGRYVRITPNKIDKADRLFAKYTLPTLIFSRYIAVVRILVPYMAGINRVRLWIYIPIMLLGSLAWTSTFILAGSVIEHSIGTVITHWRQDLIPGILILIALIVAYYFFHKWLKRKMDVPEPEEQQSDERKQ